MLKVGPRSASMTGYPLGGLVGDNPGASEAASIVNQIIFVVNKSGSKVYHPAAHIYVGHKQYYALMKIEPGDVFAVRDNKFMGVPIIRVIQESFCKLLVG